MEDSRKERAVAGVLSANKLKSMAIIALSLALFSVNCWINRLLPEPEGATSWSDSTRLTTLKISAISFCRKVLGSGWSKYFTRVTMSRLYHKMKSKPYWERVGSRLSS